MTGQAFDYAEAILKAAEIVAGKCINDIAYDVTEICTVIDDSNAKNGKYIVTNGAIKYDAYVSTDSGTSEPPRYKKDDMVRVSIMNKDYSQKKYIMGLHVTDNDTLPITYISPLDTILDMSDNIMDLNSSESLWGLTANSDIEEICLWSTNLTQAAYKDLQNNSIYDTISLKGDFKSLMSQYDVKSGSYGLRLDMYVKPNNDSEDYIVHRAYLRNEDMFGNPYSYLIFSTQAIKFDIKELGTIDTISLYFYQDRDFTYLTDDGQLKRVPITTDKDGDLISNLLVKNLYLSFGSDVANIDDNTVKIYTNNSMKFDTNATDISYNTKDIALLWYNKDENGKYLGFSDGIFDLEYDELEYLKESEFDSRLVAQQGRDIPDDENGLKLSADIEEAQVILNTLKNTITSDLYQNILSFQSRVDGICAVNSAIQQSFDKVLRTDAGTIVTAGKKLEDNTKTLTTYYTEILSRAKKRQDAETDAIPSKEGLVKITPDNVVAYIPTLIKSVNDLLNISNNIIMNNYTGFKSIWESFNTRLIKLIDKIDSIKNQFLKLLEGNQAKLDGYYSTNYNFIPYVKTDFSQYANKYCIYWYRYNQNIQEAPDRFMEKGWERLPNKNLGLPSESQNIDGILYNVKKPSALEGLLTRVMDLSLTEEKYAAIVFFNHDMFKSDILTFTNENPPVNPKEIDQNSALFIEHYSDSQDSYQAYGINNCLINAADAYRTRYLRVRYDGEKGKDEQLIGSQVFWYLPLDSTMLTYSFDDYGTDFSHDLFDTVHSEDHLEGYICFYRKIEKEKNGEDLIEEHTIFPYRIKDYYSSTFAQNDIICRVKTADNRILETSILLSFSSYGTSGTDYTLKVSPASSKSAFDYNQDDNNANLNLDISLFDYNNKELDLIADENTTVDWIGPHPYTAALSTKSVIKDNVEQELIKNCLITIDSESKKGPNEGYYHAVLKTTTKFTLPENDNEKKKRRTIDLTTITTIPYAAGREYFIEGASIVVYDSSGANPTYYKNPYRIFSKQIDKTRNAEITDVNWDIIYYKEDNTILDKSNIPAKYKLLYSYMPYLGEDNELIPCSMYLAYDNQRDYNGARLYPVVICRHKGVVIWAQPVYLMQNRYASAMLNAWDGSLQIDEENGTIMSSMVGAGRKTTNNTFEGVLMGDIGGQVNSDNATGIGLYGYHDGAQSFHFGIDGKAFLGKSGRGRILLDGNSGTISSASYQQNRNGSGADAGMMIDLDDGFIDMYGTVQNKDGSYLPDRLNNVTQSHIRIDVKSPYFMITSAAGKDIMYIAKDKYFLQSDNYEAGEYSITDGEPNTEGKGVYINLQTGALDAYNLKITSKNIFIDSSNRADPYFVIKDDDGCNLLYIGKNSYYLKTHAYTPYSVSNSGVVTYGSGMKLNLSSGAIDAYNFTLRGMASTGSYAGSYLLMDSSPKFIIHLKTGTRDFDLVNISASSFVLKSSNWDESSSQVESSSTAVSSGGYNVRSGAGTEYSIVGFLSSGTKVTLYQEAYSSDGDKWYKISATSSEWVHGGAFPTITNGGTTTHTSGSGMQVNLNKGIITGYNASNPGRGISIDADNASYPIRLGTTSNYNLKFGWDGSIRGGTTYNWSILEDGTATFNKLNANGGTMNWISLGNATISNATITSAKISSATLTSTTVTDSFVFGGETYAPQDLHLNFADWGNIAAGSSMLKVVTSSATITGSTGSGGSCSGETSEALLHTHTFSIGSHSHDVGTLKISDSTNFYLWNASADGRVLATGAITVKNASGTG